MAAETAERAVSIAWSSSERARLSPWSRARAAARDWSSTASASSSRLQRVDRVVRSARHLSPYVPQHRFRPADPPLEIGGGHTPRGAPQQPVRVREVRLHLGERRRDAGRRLVEFGGPALDGVHQSGGLAHRALRGADEDGGPGAVAAVHRLACLVERGGREEQSLLGLLDVVHDGGGRRRRVPGPHGV